MSRRAILALAAAILAAAPVSTSRAQQAAQDLLPAPTMPAGAAHEAATQSPAPETATAAETVQPVDAPGLASSPNHDGWGGTLSGSVERAPLGAPSPDTAQDTPDPAVTSSLDRHLDAVQDLLTDQEDVRPDMVEQGENLAWDQMDQAIEDGDFADVNSAEKQIGWTAKGKSGNAPKLKRPKVDLKAMTRLKLNESGSTVFDITKGRIVTKF